MSPSAPAPSSAPPATLRVRIEVPRGAFVKPGHDGRGVDLVSPLPSPFNYGSVPGTHGPDGDPWDAVVLGPRLARGTEVELPVRGRVWFRDGGVDDPKWVVGERPLRTRDKILLVGFFGAYGGLKMLRDLARLRRPDSGLQGLSLGPPPQH